MRRFHFIAALLLTYPTVGEVAGQEVLDPPAGPTPLDVYLACRHPDVLSATAAASDSLRAVANLCGLPVPRDFDLYVPESTQRWTTDTYLPSESTLLKYAVRTPQRLAELQMGLALGSGGPGDPVVLFAADSAVVSAEGAARLGEIARAFLAVRATSPGARLTVTGSADPVGDAGRIPDLAAARAVAARRVIVEAGVPLSLVDVDTASARQADSYLAGSRHRAAVISVTVPAGAVVLDKDAVVLAPAPAAMAGLGALPAAAADVLVERAAGRLTEFFLATSGRSLCLRTLGYGGAPVRDLMRRTCTMLDGSFTGEINASVDALISIVRQDLNGLPIALMDEILREGQIPPALAGPAALTRELLDVVEAFDRGTDPILILKQSALDLGSVTSIPQALRTKLTSASDLLDRVGYARATLPEPPATGAALADTLLLYSLRSAAVRGVSSNGERAPLPFEARDFNGLLELVSGVDRLRDMASEIRSASTSGGAETPDARAYGSLAMAIGASWLSLASEDSVARTLLGGTAEIIDLTRAQSYTAATARLATLLQDLRPLWCAQNTRCPTWVDAIGSYRLLQLASEVATAPSDEAVAAAMRGFLGTSRSPLAKRESTDEWKLTVNSYVGVGIGRDHWDGGAGIQYGPRIPLGLELHRSAGRVSVGLFGSIFDLGNFATLSFDDDVERAPETDWVTLFSPGGYLAVGLPWWPVSLLFGGSYVWDGRKLKNGETVDIARFTVGAAVDVPLLP